ncbi:MAG: FixH family protein [Alphaproteobacteria bacterium]|nr:FixH family protein [Alphaproteobacteria bacterium]
MNAVAKPRPSDRLIPWLFVLGFLVVFAVNAVMVTIALGSFSGLVTDRAYDRGRAYNRTLEARAAQEALGWQVRLGVVPAEPGIVRLTVEAADRGGAPLSGATVTATLVRPIEPGHDRAVDLTERGAGRYGATLPVDLAGQWEARITVARGQDRYQAARRVIVPR